MGTQRLIFSLIALLVMAVPTMAQTAIKAASKPDTITTPSGLRYIITQHGKGKQPVKGNVIIAHYIGKFLDGKVFDSSHLRKEPMAFTLGRRQVIMGWDEGFSRLHVGDKATFIIPPDLAYGEQGGGSIPANATLIFDVDFLDVKDRSLSDAMSDILDSAGLAPALEFYGRQKNKNFEGYYVSETQINAIGYSMLQDGEAAAAIEIFKINVELFPNSANVYDSLGEGYMNNDQKQEAITNYRKSLELNPDNTNAVEMLRKLQE